MKHLKLAMIALFTLVLVGSANAQDKNNPWVVGFGINSVDINDGGDVSNQFKD
jgi:OOP family OmpA-OmpF porin